MQPLTHARTFAQNAYNRLIRPHLPRKLASLNGVPVRYVRLLDVTDVFPEYEAALLSGIRNHVLEGSDAVIVGGGQGVSSVVAQRKIGEGGTVTVYEGSISQVERVRETLGINSVDDGVSVNHSIVGVPNSIWGESGNADRIDSDELPDCDALILDCEGSEIDIISGLERLPELIVVETHGYLGAPEEDVRDVLIKRGYNVVERYPENEERDIIILIADLDKEPS